MIRFLIMDNTAYRTPFLIFVSPPSSMQGQLCIVSFFYFLTGYKIYGCRDLHPRAALYFPKLCAFAHAIIFPSGLTLYQAAVIAAFALCTAQVRSCFDQVVAVSSIVVGSPVRPAFALPQVNGRSASENRRYEQGDNQ
jgi:hypothetical protein